MAKFNKDTFINEITSKVQVAISNNLITRDDIDANDIERLHGFIQYELLEYIEDRKYAIDVLKDFNYDEKISWDKLQEQFGEFKSLLDLALINLWQFLKAEGATEYGYYDRPVASSVASSNETQDGADTSSEPAEDTEDVPPYDEDSDNEEMDFNEPESEESDEDDEDEDEEKEEYRPQRRMHIRGR